MARKRSTSYQEPSSEPSTEETDQESASQEEKELVSEILSDFEKAYKHKQPKETLFREVYRRYRSYLEVTQTTTSSTLFIPESFTLVETVAPRMTAKQPTFKVLPRSGTDITKADLVGKHLEYRYDQMHLQQALKPYVKQALIYGTSFMKVGWDSEDKTPVSDPIDIADIFGDPEFANWCDGFIIHRYWRSVGDLERSKIAYINLDTLKASYDNESGDRDDTMRQDRDAIQGIPHEPNHEGCEILEEWKWVDGKIRVRVLADRSVLIRDVENPLPLEEFPFIPLFDQEVPFDKWGIGEIEPVMDLQDEENTIRNQRIDEKNLSIHNMWVVSKLAGIDYKNIVSKPGGIILANDINGIKALEKQNITQDSVIELKMIKDDIRNATGVNDYVRGAETTGSTATEVVSKTQEANQRFSEKIINLEISLKKMGKWILALDAAFLTKDVQVRIDDGFGLTEKLLKIEDIKKDYDIDIETGSSLPANPDLRRQQLIQLLQVTGPFLSSPNPLPDGLRELLRSIIQSFDLKNTDKILQGADHPLVAQAMANLDPTEMQGMNPQMIQELIRRKLQATGALNPQAQQGQPQQGTPAQGGNGTPLTPPGAPMENVGAAPMPPTTVG